MNHRCFFFYYDLFLGDSIWIIPENAILDGFLLTAMLLTDLRIQVKNTFQTLSGFSKQARVLILLSFVSLGPACEIYWDRFIYSHLRINSLLQEKSQVSEIPLEFRLQVNTNKTIRKKYITHIELWIWNQGECAPGTEGKYLRVRWPNGKGAPSFTAATLAAAEELHDPELTVEDCSFTDSNDNPWCSYLNL